MARGESLVAPRSKGLALCRTAFERRCATGYARSPAVRLPSRDDALIARGGGADGSLARPPHLASQDAQRPFCLPRVRPFARSSGLCGALERANGVVGAGSARSLATALRPSTSQRAHGRVHTADKCLNPSTSHTLPRPSRPRIPRLDPTRSPRSATSVARLSPRPCSPTWPRSAATTSRSTRLGAFLLLFPLPFFLFSSSAPSPAERC